jgi:hypothetical protein
MLLGLLQTINYLPLVKCIKHKLISAHALPPVNPLTACCLPSCETHLSAATATAAAAVKALERSYAAPAADPAAVQEQQHASCDTAAEQPRTKKQRRGAQQLHAMLLGITVVPHPEVVQARES